MTGGNFTGRTSPPVAEGFVERLAAAIDRRSLIVRLTPPGRAQFLHMANEHEGWLSQMFEGFDAARKEALFDLLGDRLGDLRLHLAQAESREDRAAPEPGPPEATDARPSRTLQSSRGRAPQPHSTPKEPA